MKMHFLIRLVFLAFVLTCVPAVNSTAQFGTAVKIHDGQVFVMTPGGAFGGLAIVSVFERGEATGWQRVQRVITEDTYRLGRPLSSSISLAQGEMFLGGGDPHGKIGAYRYGFDGTAWSSAGKLMIDESPEAGPGENMQISDFMRYIQPPRRVTAIDDDILAVGVTGGSASEAGVYLFDRKNDAWTLKVRLPKPSESNSNQFGAGISIDAGILAVGSPGDGGSGRTYVYEVGDGGNWLLSDTLKVETLENNAGFGRAVVVSSGKIIVGAPGTAGSKGSVHVFERTEGSRRWERTGEIEDPSETAGAFFGYAIDLIGEELWIGAPNAVGGEGRVYRYLAGESHEERGALRVEGLLPGWQFGASLSGAGGLAAVGVPGANGGAANAVTGGSGRAVVFESDGGDNWRVSAWLDPREELEMIAGEEISCEEGKAGRFDCEGVDLLSFMPNEAFGASLEERISDVWGWTDPETEREYALLGRSAGAAIIDVTDPVLPLYVGLVSANPTFVRDLKVYKDYLFFTGDGAGDHGLVIFDLTRLRDVQNPPVKFVADTVYTGIASAHNLILDEESGFAYPVSASQGGETCGGGLHMVDVRDPLNPKFAGCYTDTIGLFSAGGTHDGQCVVYHGPDERYTGRQICFASNQTALRIVDVTDKSNPKPLAAAKYPRVAFVHQGWLTEDHRYFFLDDELDELVGMTGKTRTLIWDIEELDDPVLVGELEGNTTATDHNLYIKGDRMYQANYQAGLRVWDVSDPTKPFEIGYFDTTPDAANPPGFVGAWTAFPFFKSGTVIVSSISEGLFMLRPREREMP